MSWNPLPKLWTAVLGRGRFAIQIVTAAGRDVVFTARRSIAPGTKIELLFSASMSRQAMITFRNGNIMSCVLERRIRREDELALAGASAEARLLAGD